MHIQMDILVSNGIFDKKWTTHNWRMPKREPKREPKEPVKKASSRKPTDHWDLEARRVLKMEMLRANVDAEGLAARIHAMNEEASTETALALRISRGTFSFGFALLALKALGVSQLDITHVTTRDQNEQ